MKAQLFTAVIFFSGLALAQEKKNDSVKTQKIEEVVMTKQVFKKKGDRFVYDVAASPVAKGNTTFDLLKQTPLLSTTDDKTLMIAGKNNAVIYINGRKSNMNTESLAQFLKNIPAENIQKIEVITVPGSEFQVESSDGIINIVLKKKTSDGLNGNMRMANSQNKYNSSSASFSANYRKDKLGISANVNGDGTIEAQEYFFRNGNQEIQNQTTGSIETPTKNMGGYLNIDYQLTEKSNLALSWNTWLNKNNGPTSNLLNTSKTYDAFHVLKSTERTQTQNIDNSRSLNNSLNLNYELKIDSLGSKLNLNAAYLYYRKFQNSDSKTLAMQNSGNFIVPRQIILQETPQIINNFSGMADYIQKFKNDFTISIGGNFNTTKTDNDTKATYLMYDDSGNLQNRRDEPNHFIYTENIYGAYITLEKKLSDKLSGKVGARYELTRSIGSSEAQNKETQTFERNYNNLLPYLSLNYAINNNNNNISYAFSSRMRRPSFWELNPVRIFITQDNYIQNNPFVKASATYNQELTYMYKNSYFLILNHTLTKDAITQVPLQRNMVRYGVTYRQIAYVRNNFGDKQEMSAMVGVQKSFFKKYLTTNFNISLQHNINNGTLNTDPTTGDVFDTYVNKNRSTSVIIQTNNTIRLDKKKTWF